MKYILLGLLGLFFTSSAFSQNSNVPVPRFQKYDIGGSFGAYLPGIPEKSLSYSEDSSVVYTASSVSGDYHFEVIAVTFAMTINDDERQQLLESYLDYLKTQFEVTNAAGYGRGHTLSTHPAAIGCIDFWKDKEGSQYAIAGWIDKKSLAVMFIWGPAEYPYINAKDLFFNGIRFPGDE